METASHQTTVGAIAVGLVINVIQVCMQLIRVKIGEYTQ